ncbi:hypothetical protein [Piscibacillus salipiscarius]|uniref:Uncharacterized protein n=1 Tax=Piscibacillus salipiscarius TaxID=299480 RepID=A0ABW5Q8X2_9BACI
MIYKGDTVRLKVHFKSLNGQSVNPVDVYLTIYDKDQTEIESIALDDTNQEDVGVFFYDYVLPNDKPEVIFEFRGLHNQKPILVRDRIESKFI